jgi:hypothetical protein
MLDIDKPFGAGPQPQARRDRSGSLHQLPEPIVVHATSIQRPRPRATLLRRSGGQRWRPAGSCSGMTTLAGTPVDLAQAAKGSERRLRLSSSLFDILNEAMLSELP